MQNKGAGRLMFALVVLSASAVGVLAYYVQNGPGRVVPPAEHRLFREAEAAEAPKPRVLYVMAPKFDGEDLTFSKKEASVPAGQDPKVFVVNEYLRGVKILDPGTRLLSIERDGGLARLHFNDKLMANGFGSEDEKTVLDGLAASLGQFKEIEKFDIYMDGQRLDTLGHAELEEPYPVIR